MSIASELTALQNDVTAARAAITAKGGSVTPNGGTSQLATDIATIPSGGGGTIGITREVTAQGVYQIPRSDFTFSTPANATDLGAYALQRAFCGYGQKPSNPTSEFGGNPYVIGVDLSSLTQISGENALSYAFGYCQNLTAVDLSNLTTITGRNAMGHTFYNCNITSLNLSKLEGIGVREGMYYAFGGNPNLTSISLPLLRYVNYQDAMNHCFSNCGITGLVEFPALKSIYGSNAMSYMFYYCTGITEVKFPALETVSTSNALDGMFRGCTNITAIHFKSSMQSTISALTGYSTSFGAGSDSSKVVFDL